jgi:hypothetical protein
MKLFTLLKSRKFWAAIIGLLLVIVKPFWPDFPLEAEQIINPLVDIIGVAVIIGSYIMGTAVEASAMLKSPPKK